MDFFYFNNISNQKINDVILLDEDESHHASRVLRKKNGDEIGLLDGNGFVGQGTITEINKKTVSVSINEFEIKKMDSIRICLAISFPKGSDKTQWILEKSCELGVSEIVSVISEHSERKTYNKDRAEKILKSACKQSMNPFLPKIGEEIKLENFIQNATGKIYFGHCDKNFPRYKPEKFSQSEHNIYLLIGPEGDFSKREISLLLNSNAHPITLGDLRLRTETAALAGLTLMNFLKN